MPAPDRTSRDRIRQASIARRRLDRAVSEAAERIARDYEAGRGANACMSDLMAAVGREKRAVPERPAVEMTDQMRKDLRTIQSSGFAGCARAGTAWRGTGGSVADGNVAALTNAGLARRDYDWRTPRLVLTSAGRKRLGAAGG